MKIVFIIDSLRLHGAQRFLTHLARGLHDLGHTQRVIVLNNVCDPEIERALSSAGCKVTPIGKWAFLLGAMGWWRLLAILKRLKPDVVVTILDFADTFGRLAARVAGCGGLVTLIRVRNVAQPSWQRWIDRKTVGWADKVVFNSRHVATYARKHAGIREEQEVVIPNGADDLLARSGAQRSRYRHRLGLSPETLLIGSVGRLYPQKNIPLLLHACANLESAQPWKLVVIGDGPERTRLLALANELDINDRVIWLGVRDDVEAWLAAMDLFVHTADFEGMPNAVMEAMAMGLPVVASAVDGTRELIQDSVTGRLAPPGDVNAFAERIRELIDNREFARQLGQRAHQQILERFGLAPMIDAYHQLFLSLAKPETI